MNTVFSRQPLSNTIIFQSCLCTTYFQLISYPNCTIFVVLSSEDINNLNKCLQLIAVIKSVPYLWCFLQKKNAITYMQHIINTIFSRCQSFILYHLWCCVQKIAFTFTTCHEHYLQQIAVIHIAPYLWCHLQKIAITHNISETLASVDSSFIFFIISLVLRRQQ